MESGNPQADMILQPLLQGVAHSYAIASDLDDATLRTALAALSVFRGPGQIAKNIAIELIRDELQAREIAA